MRHVLRVLVAVTSVLTVASPASAGSVHSASADQAFVETHAVRHVDHRLRRRGRQRHVVRLDHRLLLGTTCRQHRPLVQLHQRLPPPRLRLPQPAAARPPLRRRPLERRQPQARRSAVPRRHEAPLLVAAVVRRADLPRVGRDLLRRRADWRAGRSATSRSECEWFWALDAQGHSQQLVQHARRRTPDRLVVELEEEHRTRLVVEGPTPPRGTCRLRVSSASGTHRMRSTSAPRGSQRPGGCRPCRPPARCSCDSTIVEIGSSRPWSCDQPTDPARPPRAPRAARLPRTSRRRRPGHRES